MDKVNL